MIWNEANASRYGSRFKQGQQFSAVLRGWILLEREANGTQVRALARKMLLSGQLTRNDLHASQPDPVSAHTSKPSSTRSRITQCNSDLTGFSLPTHPMMTDHPAQPPNLNQHCQTTLPCPVPPQPAHAPLPQPALPHPTLSPPARPDPACPNPPPHPARPAPVPALSHLLCVHVVSPVRQ